MELGQPRSGGTAVTVIIIIVVASVLVACMPDYEGDIIGTRSKGAPTNSKADAIACGGGQLTPEDPNKLPKCACKKGGSARCVAKDKVPAGVSGQLDACSEGDGPGVCVPDSLVKSGGAAPPTCKSAFGEGRCMSMCVPEVAQNAELLNRGEGNSCGEDERCVPCA